MNLFYKFIKQKSPKQRFLFILGVVFIFAYWVLGIMIIFIPETMRGFDQTTRVLFGTILLLYGTFRCYRLIKKNNSEYYEDTEN